MNANGEPLIIINAQKFNINIYSVQSQNAVGSHLSKLTVFAEAPTGGTDLQNTYNITPLWIAPIITASVSHNFIYVDEYVNVTLELSSSLNGATLEADDIAMGECLITMPQYWQHLCVVMQAAARRAGGASTRTRICIQNYTKPQLKRDHTTKQAPTR